MAEAVVGKLLIKSQLINFGLYQVGWLALVLGAAYDRLWSGSVAAVVLLLLHFWLSRQRRHEWRLSLMAAALGFVVENVLLVAGVYQFSSGHPIPKLPPPWIILMWVQFAALLPYCLSWLSGRYGLAALLGLIGGPLAFLTGERIGAVTFLAPRIMHLALLGLLWSGAMPVLVFVADRLFGRRRTACTYRFLTTRA